MSDRDPTVRLLHMRDYTRKAVDMVEGRKRSELEENEVGLSRMPVLSLSKEM